MEGNKDEAERCIVVAEAAIKAQDWAKASKFLKKAQQLYPSERATKLMEHLQKSESKQQQSEGVKTEQPKKSNVKMPEAMKKSVEYTPEQEAAVKRIKQCKDYYEILNISKDATDSEIKKAYKKLALTLHPDKNHYPGAIEAFKTVGNAVTILTDPVKRKQYDTYGPDDGATSPRHRRHPNSYTFEADTTPEEIFNMFFGGGFAQNTSSNVYYRRGGRWQRQTNHSHHEHHNQRETHPFNGFVQLLPILLAIVLSMASSFFISDPAYSLQQSQNYIIPRKTQTLQVPYFVKNDFYSEYQGSVKRLELLVEEEYLTGLRHACYREKNYRDSMIWKAKNFGDRELFHTAQNIKTPSCQQLNELRGHGL